MFANKSADDDGGGNGGGSGSAGGDPVVPGSGGKTVSEINREIKAALAIGKLKEDFEFADYNDKPGKPGMRIAQLTKLENVGDDVTTQNTLGLWWDGKFHIEGYNSAFNGTFANAGFTDASVLYYNERMPGEFKISARIRIKRAGGVSTGKGINFGAFANYNANPVGSNPESPGDNYKDGIPRWKDGQGSKGMGLFFRAEATPNFRIYYSDNGGSTTAGTGAVMDELKDVKLSKEFIYEVARVKIDPDKDADEIIDYADGGTRDDPVMKKSANLMYTYKLLDSKTCKPVVYRNGYPVQIPQGATGNYFPFNDQAGYTAATILANARNRKTGIPVDSNRHPVGNTQIEMSRSLRMDVFPGISITGAVVEISQIKVWKSKDDGGNGLDWDYGDYSDKDNIKPAKGDAPVFATPDTTPAYVPVDYFTLRISPSKNNNRPSGEKDGVPVFAWTAVNSNVQWPAFNINGFKIDLSTAPSPTFADENIHYQLFFVGEHHEFFKDIQGLEERPVFTMQGQPPGETTYKKLRINLDRDKILNGETARARFVMIGRNLLLDEDEDIRNSAEYSLMQTLPEYHFWIEVTRPPAGAAWD